MGVNDFPASRKDEEDEVHREVGELEELPDEDPVDLEVVQLNLNLPPDQAVPAIANALSVMNDMEHLMRNIFATNRVELQDVPGMTTLFFRKLKETVESKAIAMETIEPTEIFKDAFEVAVENWATLPENEKEDMFKPQSLMSAFLEYCSIVDKYNLPLVDLGE